MGNKTAEKYIEKWFSKRFTLLWLIFCLFLFCVQKRKKQQQPHLQSDFNGCLFLICNVDDINARLQVAGSYCRSKKKWKKDVEVDVAQEMHSIRVCSQIEREKKKPTELRGLLCISNAVNLLHKMFSLALCLQCGLYQGNNRVADAI